MLKNIKIPQKRKKELAVLLLENGQIFWGEPIGYKKNIIGELCFNTSQTGYQEILTDPSYAGQIITFTFPHIGIVGTNYIDLESNKIHSLGCILNQKIGISSNWRSKKNLNFFLKKNKIPCLTGIDTRQLTRILATKGALKACILSKNVNLKNIKKMKIKLDEWKGLKKLDLAKDVTTKKKYDWNEGNWIINKDKYINTKKNKKLENIVCIDYGIKRNILRKLVNKFNVTVLPATSEFKEIISKNPMGIFLSNGPGDPFATGEYAVPTIKKIIKNKIPIFGICLGHQILSLALGGKTKKMFQGHRGANHPVKNLFTNSVEITSQNHGFEVDKKSFPKDIIETHISLFDKSNEGIKHKKYPFFSVQYHPEASPGPHDSDYLFDMFYKNVKKYAKKKRY